MYRHKQYEDGPVNIVDYIPFMHYPAFEKLSTKCDVPDSPAQDRAINTITPSTAELLWCMGPLETMQNLLTACPRLSLFQLIIPQGNLFKTQQDVGLDPLVGPRELVDALLETHKHTLQTLHLDFHTYYSLSDPEFIEDISETGDDEENYIYPSFRDFNNLSHLTIEFEKIASFGHLPALLKTLDLQHCVFADLTREHLTALTRLKQSWCPLIESITLSGWEGQKRGITAILRRARSLNMSVHVSADERVLTFLGVGFLLRVSSLQLGPGELEIPYQRYSDESEDEDDGYTGFIVVD